MKVVLDVNILASASVFPDRKPAIVLRMAMENDSELIFSEPIMKRLSIVLTRRYFAERLSDASRLRFLDDLRFASDMEEPDPAVRGVAPDLEDDLVLGTAVAAHADFLVTGDKRFLALKEYHGVRIVSAEEFLTEMERA